MLYNSRSGNYLTILHLTVKVLYIVNSVCQLLAIDLLLNMSDINYGLQKIKAIASFDELRQSLGGVFPRVTMCDFQVRRLGNVQRYTIQCTLKLNLLYEKIYLSLWFWLIILLLCSLLGFLLWCIRCFSGSNQRAFIQDLMRLGNYLESLQTDHVMASFLHAYLGRDGVFLLRLVEHKNSRLTAGEIASHLWDLRLEKKRENHKLRDLILLNDAALVIPITNSSVNGE